MSIYFSSGVARVIVSGGGEVTSGEGILGGPPPNFYMDLDFSNGLEHNWEERLPPPRPPLTMPLYFRVFFCNASRGKGVGTPPKLFERGPEYHTAPKK